MFSGPVKHHWKAGGTCESSFLVLDLVALRTTGGLALGVLAGGGGGTGTGLILGTTSCPGSSGTSMMRCAEFEEEEPDCIGTSIGTDPTRGAGTGGEAGMAAAGTRGSTLAFGTTLTGAGAGSLGSRYT